MLTVNDSQFLLDDQPFRILSGAMHYFRVMPEYWRDRLEKMRQFGLNTVETYVPWNLHEPRPGEFHFEGRLDIARYIQTAAEVGLKVIVRPGPYICSEWDFGGLPAWLLKDPLMQVRCMYPPYLAAVDRFLDRLLPVLRPWQATNGGPLIACQVENEYGSFGNDQVYVQYIADGLRKRGVDVLLFTSDGPTDGMLQGGTLPDILTTVNFAFDAPAGLAKLRQYRPTGPQMVAEFWAGWFDHWGEEHHVSPDGGPSFEPSVQSLDEILAAGASVNFYMFHGGTNFGFMSGANYYAGTYLADVTSYDYASPLDEAGDPTPRFAAYRAVMEKYLDLPPLPVIPPSPKAAYGPVQMSAAVGLLDSLDVLSQKQRFVTPPAMEMLDQDYGFILYQTRISGPRPEGTLNVRNLHDRAHVFVNGALCRLSCSARPAMNTWRLLFRKAALSWLSWWKTWAGSTLAPSCSTAKAFWVGLLSPGSIFFTGMSTPCRSPTWSGLSLALCQPQRLLLFSQHFTAPVLRWTSQPIPSWRCRAGAKGWPGSMVLTWAAIGRADRSRRCMCPPRCSRLAATSWSFWNSTSPQTR